MLSVSTNTIQIRFGTVLQYTFFFCTAAYKHEGEHNGNDHHHHHKEKHTITLSDGQEVKTNPPVVVFETVTRTTSINPDAIPTHGHGHGGHGHGVRYNIVCVFKMDNGFNIKL